MARGTARREAYTAGGEASLWSLVILNVGAFIFQTVGAAPAEPVNAIETARVVMY